MTLMQTDQGQALKREPGQGLGLDAARAKLKEVWGYEDFRPLQDTAVQDVLDGRDSVVILPTGGGKSLCYQVPALVRDGMAVVVSPLISLMKDQVDALQTAGVSAALINSSQSDEQKKEVAAKIRRGEIEILYMAPERLVSNRTLDFLMQHGVSFFAVDEAHCVSNWGHDFRPEYRELSVLRDRFPNASIHAFTATASARVRDDIAAELNLRDPEILVGGFDRPNLTYRMMRSEDRIGQIREVIDRHPGESGIVYAITRKEVEQIAGSLADAGVKAGIYHAGLDDQTRQRNQEKFLREEMDVVVATVAFGMGIDKANVRYVVHAGMPKSIEHYQQESGRAGRDGLPSECVLLYGGGDVMTWKRILEMGDRSNFDAAMQSVNDMADVCTSLRCRHATLVGHFGQEYAADNCGACDVCLGEMDLIDDPLVVAQKILSCVYRLKERFGGVHTAKVLIGSRDNKIVSQGHDQLSTYGLLSDHPIAAIKTWIDQLVSQGYAQRVGEYQTLQLTDRGRDLLRINAATGSSPVQLVKVKTSTGRSRGGVAGGGGGSRKLNDAQSWEGVDRDLFEQLRSLRKQIADDRSVPAYVVFGDKVLREMARVRPTTTAAMGELSGVGAAKLKDFGDDFLAVIQQAGPGPAVVATGSSGQTNDKPKPSIKAGSPADAAKLFAKGMSIDQVAEKLGRARSTTVNYLIQYLEANRISDPKPYVETDNIELVEMTFFDHPDEEKLKPIHEALEGKVSYEDLKIIGACLRIGA